MARPFEGRDYAYCDMQGVPAGDAWVPMMKKYEADVLSAR